MIPTLTQTPDFDKMPDGLIPAIIQDSRTATVLMLGYMNAEALQKTQETGLVTFFSRSKQRLWTKGEESGNVLHLRDIRLDCDNDTLLIQAEPAGPVCHTGADTCWNRPNVAPDFLHQLENIIWDRNDAAPTVSYTAQLFASGIGKIAQKVGEEAIETIIEALGNDRKLLLNETADLLYHLLVLLAAKEIRLEEVENVLLSRHNK
ncbi:MAG TPA: bifunctional phosphoribosyl-AMP cyclohydrolase/phosphoribosyl-ATP diphosphatase HisIE [Saprospiraceae bacterium]|nr:bifunctional phosphoribosyl-AMP cyclohydrolase/phosphoribosyl-ATP diphosphatase HisIE [Saprospiraceae bacterium]HPI08999.1 bifunctional phosphoribosyl-AMP cyclohydrolase/phosphoribosyl-ATP diphosphatase HisIE [Saprospiraceae bacterium]